MLIRKGECNHCGDCCRYTISNAIVPMQPGASAEYIRMRQLTVLDGTVYTIGPVLQPCPQHAGERCMVQDRKPPECVAFPSHPDQLIGLPRCGYWFENERGEKREARPRL